MQINICLRRYLVEKETKLILLAIVAINVELTQIW